jgi:KDO2-lipid IV(A) lauroyltransferase
MNARSEDRRMDHDPVPPTTSFRHILSNPAFYRLGFSVANRIPLGILYSLADLVGDASFFRYEEKRESLRRNLVRAFPDMPAREVHSLARRVFRNYARYLTDYGRFRGMSTEKLDRTIPEIEGLEYARGALHSPKGTILVTGHIGNWELGALYFARMGLKVNVVVLPDNAPQIDAIRENYRSRHSIRTIAMDGSPFTALEIMTALRRGELVAMLVDRSGAAEGVEGEFFGKPHFFPRGPFLLSRATGAMILPAFIVRDGNGYRGYAENPFVAEGPGDEPYVRRLAESLERIIRRFPDQWYNFLPI